MNHINHKIDYLISLGFDYNLEEGENWLISYLEDYHDIEDENYPLWLIIREMGNQTIVDKKLQRFSQNVSTIVYEDFFFTNKLSNLLSELQQITNGAISYQVIDEFDALYHPDGALTNDGVWERTNQPGGISSYKCKYEICGQAFEFDYLFYDPVSTYLNPEFVTDLCAKLDQIFFENNVNYYSEEFITFFQLPQEAQEKLNDDSSAFLNKGLIKKFRKTEFEKKREQLLKEKAKKEEERLKLFLLGQSETRLATKEEITRLEDYKKRKSAELNQVIVFSTVLTGLIIWALNIELLKIMPIQVFFWGLLIAVIWFTIFVINESKLRLIKKDLEEQQIERRSGIISSIYKGNGRTVVRFKKGVRPSKFIAYDEYWHLNEGNEIVFDVFHKSKVFSNLVEIKSKKHQYHEKL